MNPPTQSQKNRILTSALAAAAFVLCMQFLQAAEYTVPAGGSLPNRNNLADGDTITIMGDIIGNNYNVNSTFKTGLKFRSGLANGEKITIDANNVNRVFEFRSGDNITIDNIILRNGIISGNNDGGAIRFTGEVLGELTTINGSFEIHDSDSSRHGGAINVAGITSLQLNGNVYFSGNTSVQRAGALQVSDGNLTLNGDAVFTSNTAGYDGGAISVYLNNTSTMTAMGETAFSYNRAGYHGGAVFARGDVIFEADTVFTSNTASYNGGGIYAGNKLVFEGSAIFSTNSGSSGGAIWMNNNNSTLAISGSASFQNNAAVANGGAIYSKGNTYIGGSTIFSGNIAGGEGGAIYFYTPDGAGATLTLDATLGDIKFADNKHGASVAPNAIIIRTATAAGTASAVILNTGTGTDAHTIAFHDPIATTSADATAAITQKGAGTVLFDTHHSEVNAVTTIESGTLKLTRGAVYGQGSALGSFTLEAPATLSGNGAVRSDTITLAAGSTLEVLGGGALALEHTAPLIGATGLNLAGFGTISADGTLSAASIRIGSLAPDAPSGAPLADTAQTLTFAPGTTLRIEDGGIVAVDMFGGTTSDKLVADMLDIAGTAYINFTGLSGTYSVVATNNSVFTAGDFAFLVNGLAPTARYGATPTVKAINSGAGSELVVEFSKKNVAVAWTGSNGSIWKHAVATDANWTDGASISPENYFQDGDAVSFGDTSALKAVTIDTAGVTVAHMTVNNTAGNDYTFTGAGGITSSTTASVGNLVTPTGKLSKNGAGALNFANTSANNFVGGIEISGGTIGFTAANQLGDGGKGIHFTADAALRANANDLTLANKLLVDSTVTATLDTGANTLTYAGDLSGVAATGTLAKTGAGTLNLASDYSAYAASTRISEGALNLSSSSARLGGRIDIAAGAILSGIGTATGDVFASPGAIIQPGLPGSSGTLSFQNLTLNSSIVRIDLYDSNVSDRINILGALSASGANIIDLGSFVSGTFDLGNITGLSTAEVYIGGIAQPVGARQTASLSTSGASLILTAGADISRILRWTGSTSAIWTPGDANWTDGGSVTLYAGGDRAIFDGIADSANSGNRVITIAGSGMTVSDIHVQGSASYTFDGSGITADASTVVDGAALTSAQATGKLIKAGSGTLAFVNAANTFKGGIEHGGGAITFTTAAQLGDGGKGIRFTGDATLAPAADALVLANNIIVDAGRTGAIDTGAYTLTLSGTLGLGVTSGTLAKMGAGTLRITGNSAAATNLATNVAAGALLLDGGALGGTINVAANATFGGIGSAPSLNSVRTVAGSVIQAGLGGTPNGVLNIANLQLSDGATLASVNDGVLAGAATLDGTVTASIGAGNSLKLTGSATGSGKLVKTGAGNLVYTDASALGYTGGTQIDDGYVMLRDIADASSVAHTVILNGGWLDLSDTEYEASGTAANTWGSLAITQGANASAGGVIGGNDMIRLGSGTAAYGIGSGTKTGVFVVVDAGNGTAELTGANHYKGYTRIDTGTLRVTDDAQLGDTAAQREVILNGGALQISGSIETSRAMELRADGAVSVDSGINTTWAAITKNTGTTPATFTKAGSGTLTLTGANAVSGMEIVAGKFIARTAAGAGTGAVIIASGATFEFKGTPAGTSAAGFTGDGTLAIDGGLLTLAGANDIARIAVSNSATVTVNTANSIGAATTALELDNARINFNALSVVLGHVTMSNASALAFNATGTVGTSFKQATLSSLSGGGTLIVNTNLGLGRGDKFIIRDSASGDYTLRIVNAGSAPTGFTTPITLVQAPASSTATFSIPEGKIDVGILSYALMTDTSGGALIINIAGMGALSNAGEIIKNMSGALPLSWFAELDTVNKRLGDLRLDTTQGKGGLSSWVRVFGQSLQFDPKATGIAFTERQAGVETGMDYKARGTALGIWLGGFIGYGHTERSFKAAGDGSSDSMHGGVYGTLATSGGWYVDGVLKVNGFKNKLSVSAITGESLTGEYSTFAVGGSLDAGKYCDLGKGWFVEPQLQAAYTVLGGNEYETSNGINVELRWGTTTQARAGLMFGRTFKSEFGEFFQIYLKGYGASQWTTDGQIVADGTRISPAATIKGDRIEGGAGFAWMPSRKLQLYFDFETASADYYSKPWGLNFGLRYGW